MPLRDLACPRTSTCLSHASACRGLVVHACLACLALQAAGELPLRVELTVSSGEEGTPPPAASPPLLRCVRVKIFGDGSLGAETAALRMEYVRQAPEKETDEPEAEVETEAEAAGGGEGGEGNRGTMIFGPEELRRRVGAAHAAGYRLEVHAIGDAAAEAVLDAMEEELPLRHTPLPLPMATEAAAAATAAAAAAAAAGTHARPVLTHCQVLGTDLIERMARLGVVANVQPSFVPTDARFVERRLPAAVHPTSYCWRSLLAAGVWCAGGSDAPVELPRPLLGMHDLMVRRVPRHTSSHPPPRMPHARRTHDARTTRALPCVPACRYEPRAPTAAAPATAS